MDEIPVTPTRPGMSKREIAITVIADKLGIAEAEVKDDTLLGDSSQEIGTVICFKTGNMIVGRPNMIAADIFRQLR